MNIVRYTPDKKAVWDAFVRTSRNGTFLHLRDYMDYHAHRFTDCSLMFFRDEKPVALLPANWVESERTLHSHQGLTYGGVIVGNEFTTVRMLELFDLLLQWVHTHLGAVRLSYKAVPHIYHRYPCEEDLYALFRRSAQLVRRSVSSVIEVDCRLPMRKGRKSTIKQARLQGVTVRESDDWSTFWDILTEVLHTRHGAQPVHTLSEMLLLKSRFPEQIHLFAAYAPDGEMIGGSVVYEFSRLIHSQYIAASPVGKEMGAVDAVYDYLIAERYADKHYVDFGTSVEQGGWVLNEGLVRQKEAFGARAVVYDVYEITIE